MGTDTIRVEVAYALPERQEIVTIEVMVGCSVERAIEMSGIVEIFPEIDLTKQAVGIFSHKCELTTVLKAGDRIEIYRPLLLDPKEVRRAKAAKTAKPRKQ